MPVTVVFVAPFYVETTLRFLDAVVHAGGVRVGLVTQEPLVQLPPAIRAGLAAHWRIDDGLDVDQIAGAVRALGERLGPPQRLLGILEQLQVPLAQVRERLGIPGMGVESARNFRDKSRMKSVLREAGVPCARHALAVDRGAALAFAVAVGFPLIVKPPAGSGARDTFRVPDRDSLERVLTRCAPSAEHPCLLEEFVTGAEHFFDTVSIGGQHRWNSISHYLPTPLEVVENRWIQWCVLLPREVDDARYDDIRAAGTRALDALGMDTGLSHMEWFRRDDGSVVISEVGARPPGAHFTTLIGIAHGMDLYRAWAGVVVHDRFEPPARRQAAGIAFLRGQGEGRVTAIHGLDRAQAEVGGLVVEARLPQPGQASTGGYEGEGHVIVRHPETAVVEQALARVVSLVRVELG